MKKLFVNKYEEITNNILIRKSKEHDIHIYSKVRLADVFDIKFGITPKEIYNYALKSHFDFTVYNYNYYPLFVVEVDGIQHNTNITQRNNDIMKNKLCKINNLPILRINSNYILKNFREMTLLDWLIDVWFLRDKFLKAQEDGLIPLDEWFDPDDIINHASNNKIFPYDFTYDLKMKINSEYKNKLYDSSANFWIGTDNNNNYHGIAHIHVTKEKCIIAESGIKKTTFPVILSELLSKILQYELYTSFLENHYILISIEEKEKLYRKYIDKYKLVSCCGTTGYKNGENPFLIKNPG